MSEDHFLKKVHRPRQKTCVDEDGEFGEFVLCGQHSKGKSAGEESSAEQTSFTRNQPNLNVWSAVLLQLLLNV